MSVRARAPVIAPPVVDHLPEYVRGFPLHFALTVTLLSKVDANKRRLPGVSLEDALDVKAVFTRRGGDHVATFGGDFTGHVPERGAEGDITPFVDLDPGEPRRLLFDASLLPGFSFNELPAGSYAVELTYNQVAASPFDIILREPTPAEKNEIALIEKQRQPAWVEGRHRPDWLISGNEKAPPPISKADPLRYLRVLHFLFTSSTEPGAVNPNLLEALDGFMRPKPRSFTRSSPSRATMLPHSSIIATSFAQPTQGSSLRCERSRRRAGARSVPSASSSA